jgi:hypothetical protein
MRRFERIIYRKLNLEFEHTPLIGAFCGSHNKSFPTKHIFIVRACTTIGGGILLEVCEFLLNAP